MSQFTSVHVGNLDPMVTEQILYDHFVRIGPVMSVRVCSDPQTQKSLGYGYVNFQTAADAEKALDELGAKILSKFIRVAKVQRDPSQRRSGVTNIVVKRLPSTFEVPDLKELFSKFGRITSLRMATDEKGGSRGYAYIAYEKEDSAAQAVKETNDLVLDDKPITVERYQPHHHEEQQKNFTNLYVKNLDAAVTDEAFTAYFAQFGEVTSAKVRSDFAIGYVAFERHEAAAAAIEAGNEKPATIAKEGTTLVVRRFMPSSERLRNRDRQRRERQLQYSKYPNLYVKNFDEFVTNERLKELFERVGPTVSVRVMTDSATKVSRCFGFVSMRDQSSALKAISELTGSTFLGVRPLFVTYALKRDARRQALDEMYKKNQARAQPMGGLGPMGGAGMYPAQMMAQGMGPGPQMFSGGMPMMRQQMAPMAMMGAPMRGLGPALPPQLMAAQRPRPPPKPAMPQPMMMSQVVPQAKPLTSQSMASLLASMNPEQQKNVLGERIYNYILRKNPGEAAKVTGMLLEMDNAEILNLLDTSDLLDAKISEALDVLHRHGGV